MDWWEWLLLAFVVLSVLGIATCIAVRTTRRGRRFLALSIGGKLRFGRDLIVDPRLPLVTRIVLAVLIGYLALPFDLIPDFIPVVGHLDDLAVGILAIALLLILVPGDRFDAALAEASTEPHR